MKDHTSHHGEHNLDDSHISNPDVRHEESDVRVKPIVLFMFWLFVITGIIALLMVLLFDYFERREIRAEGKPSPFAGERNEIPPAPLLQLAPKDKDQLMMNKPPDLKNDHPLAEMKRLREEEDRKLENYTWVDQQKGIVSLPIEDAKRLILQRGLLQSRPQRTQAPAQTRPEREQATAPANDKAHSAGAKQEDKQ